MDAGALTDFVRTNATTIVATIAAAAVLTRVISPSAPAAGGVAPPNLSDPVPYVYNTLQFVVNNEKFMSRVREALSHAPIIKFWLGGNPVYVLSELKNYQAIMSSKELTYNGIMLQIGFPRLWRMADDEIKRFASDKSGLRDTPLPGTEGMERFWTEKYHALYDYLGRPQQLKPIVDEFGRQFGQVVEGFPVGEWKTLSVTELTRTEFTKCAIVTLFGPKIFDITPDFLDIFWGFDEYASSLVWGFPEWSYPAPYKAHDKFLEAIAKYIDNGLEKFDWQGPDAEIQWEPLFGARVSRELAKWGNDKGFRRKTIAGSLGTLLFGQNSNTIPIVAWIIMELNSDPALMMALREEVQPAFATDPSTGERTVDITKLLASPLLQSLFTEVLRLRMSMVIMRVADKPTVISGVAVEKGAHLHAYTHLAQTDEATWGSPDHPASEFWAERHIKHGADGKREFVMAANPGNWFPFGGGVPACPGRHFAKNEIFTMVGLLVDRFDMEFVKWTKLDGSPSDRPANSDPNFSGIGALPADRDMVVRWKRRW